METKRMPGIQQQDRSADEKGKELPLKAFLTRLIWYCVLPLAAISFWLAFDHVRTLQAQRDGQAVTLARNATILIDSHLDSQIAALEILAGSVLIDNPQHWPAFYQRSLGYLKIFTGHIIFADTTGRMIFNTRTPYGAQLPNLPMVKGHAAAPEALKTGKPAVGDMFMGPVAGKPLIAIAVPVIRNGQTKYLLLTTIEASHIGEHLDAISLPDGWSLSAIDGKGEIMASSSSALKDNGAAASDTRKFQSKSNVSHWTVILEIPREIYMAPVYSASATLIVAILMALFVGVFGGRLAGRRLSREVKTLTDDTSRNTLGLKIEEIDAARSILNNAYAELREKELQYRNLADSGLALIWTSGTDKLCNYFNKPWLKFTGRTMEQEMGKGWTEGVHPDDLDRCIDTYVTAFDKHEAFDMEYRLRHVSGEYRWIKDMGAPNYNSSGEFVGYIGHCFDVTEHKKALDELRKNEKRLKEVQEMARLGYWSWDVKTGAVEWSDEVYKIFRLNPDEFTPKIDSILALSPWPEEHERDRELIRRAMESREKGDYEQRFLRPDKSIGYYYSTFQGHYDESGELVMIVGSVMDITERKKAEATQTRLLRILESSLNEIYVFDSETLIFEYVNKGALGNLGYTADRIKNMTPVDIKPEFTEVSFREALAPLLNHERDSLVFETVHRRADSSVYPVEVHIQLVELEGQKIFLAVILDITERKKAETELLDKVAELERFQRLTVGRELAMIELKKEVNELLIKYGLEAKYWIVE
jgi:PAS domain S-box-containing protein